MSDYWPTILELTPPLMPWTVAVYSVFDLLETKYLANFRKWRKLPMHSISCDSSTIILGSKEVWIEIQVNSGQSESKDAQITICLDSKAYELAYDVILQRANWKGRRDLMQFCVDIAAATRAEGFRLMFEKTISHPLDIHELVRNLKSVNGDPGLIDGLASSSVHWPKVCPFWSEWNAMEGYNVKEFLS